MKRYRKLTAFVMMLMLVFAAAVPAMAQSNDIADEKDYSGAEGNVVFGENEPASPSVDASCFSEAKILNIKRNVDRIRVFTNEVKVEGYAAEDVRYQIKYKRTSDLADSYKTIDTDLHEIVIGGLEESTPYTVKVRAYVVDQNGERVYGSYSELKRILTMSSGEGYRLPDAEIMKVTSSNGALKVTIDSERMGAMNLKYQIKYKKTSEDPKKYVNVNSTNSVVVLKGLKSGERYTLKARCYFKDSYGNVTFGRYSDLERVYAG